MSSLSAPSTKDRVLHLSTCCSSHQKDVIHESTAFVAVYNRSGWSGTVGLCCVYRSHLTQEKSIGVIPSHVRVEILMSADDFRLHFGNTAALFHVPKSQLSDLDTRDCTQQQLLNSQARSAASVWTHSIFTQPDDHLRLSLRAFLYLSPWTTLQKWPAAVHTILNLRPLHRISTS